jgi:GTPase SAR1 family protein
VRELQRQGNPNIVIALAGNKSDLASKRKVEPDEARQYAEENNIMFMETSAKTASNVNELFVQIARKLPKQQQPEKPGTTAAQGVKLNEPKPDAKSSCSGSC